MCVLIHLFFPTGEKSGIALQKFHTVVCVIGSLLLTLLSK